MKCGDVTIVVDGGNVGVHPGQQVTGKVVFGAVDGRPCAPRVVRLVVEGTAHLTLSPKTVGLFEAFYSSLRPVVLQNRTITITEHRPRTERAPKCPLQLVIRYLEQCYHRRRQSSPSRSTSMPAGSNVCFRRSRANSSRSVGQYHATRGEGLSHQPRRPSRNSLSLPTRRSAHLSRSVRHSNRTAIARTPVCLQMMFHPMHRALMFARGR